MQSLPTRERGLKPAKYILDIISADVAPYAGAWIETILRSLFGDRKEVAPYAGAWIETSVTTSTITPFAGRSLRGSVD